MDTPTLITEIFKRPPIWMTKHPQHKHKTIVKRLWEEIKQRFPEYDVEQLKKKWKNLKDTYRKELKKIPTSHSGVLSTDIQSQWSYFEMMSFTKDELMPVERDFSPVDNKLDETEDFDAFSQSEVESSTNRKTVNRKSPPREDSPQLSSSESETSHPPPKRSKANDIRSELIEIEKKKLKILEREVARQNTDTPGIEKTDDYYFLMSLLPEMQKLTPIQKMRLRNKINQALMDEISMGT